ncbi:hypothetical protein QBC33DRAFT_582346 [Phialemonium atrogriseum]|uniref:Cell wall mannoprotein PIR1-like C-terminal domain-containing protein n=1 Tax=Phialemonium atrogriseum TaxID=1093897 RepID=A0AAJ0CBD6_9PEZI|nr:uncharacterized protein QBC33DRAFT_582346 [Phialemonium atrogriseum]KAK1772114.1 hypothetical protein QBC33DRAFT_582346 [Phialemonium atrogriseum]
MKISITGLVSALSLLPEASSATWFGQAGSDNSHLQRRDKGCSFTLLSSGSFACPAGQLPDGQIRLNGTEETATFYITDGGITDSQGFGCIVTAPPTTQIQCDQGTAPDAHFSIGATGNLLYNSSPNFFACPATDTEYNVYVDPNFGQGKCFPITLQASGCGAPATSPCPAAETSTVWQTLTVTSVVDTTVTVAATNACSSATGISVPPRENSTSLTCHHCTKSHTSTGINSRV